MDLVLIPKFSFSLCSIGRVVLALLSHPRLSFLLISLGLFWLFSSFQNSLYFWFNLQGCYGSPLLSTTLLHTLLYLQACHGSSSLHSKTILYFIRLPRLFWLSFLLRYISRFVLASLLIPKLSFFLIQPLGLFWFSSAFHNSPSYSVISSGQLSFFSLF